MPEAAVHKNHLAPGWEADVRLAGKVLSVKSVTVPQMVKQLAGARFGPRVCVSVISLFDGAPSPLFEGVPGSHSRTL